MPKIVNIQNIWRSLGKLFSGIVTLGILLINQKYLCICHGNISFFFGKFFCTQCGSGESSW